MLRRADYILKLNCVNLILYAVERQDQYGWRWLNAVGDQGLFLWATYTSQCLLRLFFLTVDQLVGSIHLIWQCWIGIFPTHPSVTLTWFGLSVETVCCNVAAAHATALWRWELDARWGPKLNKPPWSRHDMSHYQRCYPLPYTTHAIKKSMRPTLFVTRLVETMFDALNSWFIMTM